MRFYEFDNGDPTCSAQVVSPTVVKVVIPDLVAFVVSVRKGGVIGRTAVIGLRAVTLPAFGIVVTCPVALLVAIAVSALVVGLRSLVVIARLAREVGVGDSHEFIESGTSSEH
jgi:hypothetical protein